MDDINKKNASKLKKIVSKLKKTQALIASALEIFNEGAGTVTMLKKTDKLKPKPKPKHKNKK